MWSHLHILKWKERAFSDVKLCLIESFQMTLFNKEIWTVPHIQHYNYFTLAGQRQLEHVIPFLSQQAHVVSMRSTNWEIVDPVIRSDYHLIAISSWSIVTPLPCVLSRKRLKHGLIERNYLPCACHADEVLDFFFIYHVIPNRYYIGKKVRFVLL